MKKRPTTFQLAQLAAQAAADGTRPKDAVRRAWELWTAAEAELAEHDNRIEFLRSLFWTHNGRDIPIFTDSPAEWCERLKAYPGDQRDVEKALWNKEFPTEEVQKQLFKDKKLGRDTRRTFLVGLVKACIRFDMEGPLAASNRRLEYLGSKLGEFIGPREGFPIHPKNLELAEANYKGIGKMEIPKQKVRFVEEAEAMLSKPKQTAVLVRWAVEVRQKQLALARSRVIPESLRTQDDELGPHESIQFKRKYRQ